MQSRHDRDGTPYAVKAACTVWAGGKSLEDYLSAYHQKPGNLGFYHLQSQSQLKAIYKDAAEIISDNCDSVLFLSGRGKNAKEISDALGKETIDSFNTSENRGSQTSHGLNYQKLGKELMSQDEIAVMDGGKCILQLRGVRPFLSEKFDITKHPRYKYLADADKKNTFDVDRFLAATRRKRQQVVTQDEVFDLYEIDLSDEDAAAE